MRALGQFRRAIQTAAELLWPESCGGCRRELSGERGLCEGCWLELLRLVSLGYCPRCGATLGPFGQVAYEDGCARCPTPLPRFARVLRLGPYAGPIRRAVREAKYRGWDAQARRLGGMLAASVRATLPEETFDVVMGVPMFWTRRFFRPADHAGVLGAVVARQLDLPFCPELLRKRNTPPQVHLSRTERFANIRGAFGIRSRRALAGARVLLVDDVTTSTATGSEAARTLLDAGALRVSLAVLAKGEPPAAYAEPSEQD